MEVEAARLTDRRQLRLVEERLEEPGPGEVLIRVAAVGLCGSDAHWFEEGGIGDAVLARGGLVLGHEFAGVVDSGPEAGRRVAVDPAVPCLRCKLCRDGRLNLCPNLRFAGHGTTDGALRSHIVWPERCLVPLPEHLPIEQGALLEPLGVALHAIDLAGADHETAGVVGCGPIGLLLVAALAERGSETIVAFDLLGHRVTAAALHGATETAIVNGGEDDYASVTAVVGDGLDVVFETAGTDQALNMAVRAARPGGTVVQVGIPTGDRHSLIASTVRRKEVTVIFCRRMLPTDLVAAADLASRGAIDLDSLISHRYSLAAAGEAFGTLVARTGLKVIVAPAGVHPD